MTRRGWLLALLLIVALPASIGGQGAQELYQQALVQEHARGNLEEAIALYAQAARAAAGDRTLAAQALRRLAGCQEKLGATAAAADAYATLIRTYPEQRTEAAVARERLVQLRRITTQSTSSRSLTVPDIASQMRPLADEYCARCHNSRNTQGGLDLEALIRSGVGVNTARWETVVQRLLARRDPPMGLPRPDDATYASVVAALEGALDAVYATTHPPLQAERIPDLQLAERIAAFLWNQPPDAMLLDAARRGDLRAPGGLQEQVRRMLRDPRTGALVDRFFVPWLSLDRIAAHPDAASGTGADAALVQSMRTETRLFLLSQLRDDRNVVDVWTADYTYVDERLARHYGLSGVTGQAFRRVAWPDRTRGGLLGQAGPLTVSSSADRTSPTRRGVFVLTRFLGLDAPDPPANVPPLAENRPAASGTLRNRITAHRSNPSCASCHSLFDPLGFALENFDASGRWRTTDGGAPIDASGTFVDGTPFDGPAELRTGLLKYRAAYFNALTRRLLADALGRSAAAGRVYDYEMPAVRKIVRDASAHDYRWSAILAGICASAPFQMQHVVP